MAKLINGPRFRYSGHDVLCFTACIKGPAFAAGVIHAYLAADRKPPTCVAVISFGAVSAAAVQRAYRKFERVNSGDKQMLEIQRWGCDST